MPPRVANRREIFKFEFEVDDVVYVNGTMRDVVKERVHEHGHNLYRVVNNGWVRGDEMRREPWKWYSFVRNGVE